MRFRRLLQNFNVLNIVLIAAVISFAAYSILPTFETSVKFTLPAAKKVEETVSKEPPEPDMPSVMQYAGVIDENLFHPERRMPPEKKEEAPLPKPEFVLYGTMISDDLSLAYIEDMKAPRNTPGRGKRQVALKKGDSMSGFILGEIETDKVVMTRGEERLVVAINDPQKAKAREFAAPATTAQPQAAPTAPAPRQRELRRAAAAGQTPAQAIPRSAPQAAPN